MFVRATTTGSMKCKAWSVALPAVLLVGAANAQTFSAPPVIFAPTGSNNGLTQQVSVTLTAASTIRSIAIPLPLAAQPEFFFVDNGGCVEDGTTVNAPGTVCSLTVRFHPAIAGLRTASLIITDGAGNATAIPISGVGYYPQISVIPSAMKIVAGLGPSQSGLHGDGDAAILASLSSPHGVAADSFGNIYIADMGNNVVRMMDAFGNITTVAGGGAVAKAAADGGLATAASLASPTWLAVDAAGNLYIAESGNHVVRRVSMSTSRTISTVAGSYAQGFSGDGASAAAAQLNTPEGVAADAAGNLYIADSGNSRIRRVDAVTGNISTFAGTGAVGFNASSTLLASAKFSAMSALALDASGNLFVADTGNHAVREIIGGNVTVVAGTGAAGVSGDGGAATAAQLNSPAGLAISPAGDLFISDSFSCTVRKVQASDGTIETVAGNPVVANSFTNGVSPSTSVGMNAPQGIAFDTASNLLVADSANNVVRALSPSPAELKFATQSAGTSSAPQSFRIENIGNAPLTLVGTAAANSTTSANFSLANGSSGACGLMVASGAHCNYSVTYVPAANGSVSGEFDVTYQSANPNFNSIAPVFTTGGSVAALMITPATLAAVVVNTSVSAPITTTGGTGTVALNIEGALPPGITSTVSNGTLTLNGTPTQAGSYSLTVFATDALGATATQTYTLQVLPTTVTLNLAETVHAVDSTQSLLSLQLTLAESVHITDIPTELLSKSLNVAEMVHVIDAANEIPQAFLTVTEAIHVSDVPAESPSVTLAVLEAIHLIDTPKEILPVTLAVLEAIHLTDESKETLPVTLAIVEAIHLADVQSDMPSALSAISEALHVTDVVNIGVGPASQTITVPKIPNHTYGDANFNVNATASSGLPVTIAVQSGPASISGTLLSLNGAGRVTLLFTQAGNANYAAAPSGMVSFSIGVASATLTANNATRAFETTNPVFTYTIAGLVHGDTALSGTPLLTTSATPNSPAGGYPINISAGNLSSPNYMLTFVPGTFTITGATNQSITFSKLPSVPLNVGPLTLTAHSTSGLSCTYTVSGPASLQNGKLLLTGTGAVTVTASQAGNATFNAATPVSRTFTVLP